MCAGGDPLRIFGESEQSTMQPSSHLLPGTAASIKRRGPSDSYYWLTSVMNFPGIDGVLSYGRNIYTLQASIAKDHRAPIDGIPKTWDAVSPEVREQCTWHFIVVADDEHTTKTLRAKFAEQLVYVQVWALGM